MASTGDESSCHSVISPWFSHHVFSHACRRMVWLGCADAIISFDRDIKNELVHKSSRRHVNGHLEFCCLKASEFFFFSLFSFCFLHFVSEYTQEFKQLLLCKCDGTWCAHNISKAPRGSSSSLLCTYPDLRFICFFAMVTVEPGLCWKWLIISCFAWVKLFHPSSHFLHTAENMSDS